MNENPLSDAGAAPRTAWQRHVIDPIAAQLTQGITPEKVALTLAVGILLRLNQPIIQLVNALCTPFHLPVIYFTVRLGNWLFAAPYEHVSMRMMNHMLWEDPREFFEKFGMNALHAMAAWACITPLWIPGVFMLALPVLREALRRKSVITCQPVEPPVHPVP